MTVIRIARRWWRQLTSMRTALVLLFLLALAAVPGSIWPQRNVSPGQVDNYRTENPELSRWLDQLGMFDVFAAPWFAAIYLLLMISLVGCLLPRMRDHLRAVVRRPPPAPRNLSRLPVHAQIGQSALLPGPAADRLGADLRRRRYRVAVRRHDDGTATVSAEKGQSREAGNLLFHFSLLGLLGGVAVGYGWGWYGNRLLVAGPDTAFCTTTQQFDEYGLGPRTAAEDLPGYCLELERFTAQFLDNGQPIQFRADVRWSDGAAPATPYTMQVNEPLRLGDATVYLLGHGYAPELRYTDSRGRTQTTVVPFLPYDASVSSEGVAMFPDANADGSTGRRSRDAQLAFAGTYLPTAGPQNRSLHPAERDPVLTLSAYRGDLGLENGSPQSVYSLPARPLADGRLERLVGEPKALRPGQVWTLDDGSTLEFTGTRRWVTLTIRDDPGEMIVLVAAVALLAGLTSSLAVRRRRFWYRLAPGVQGTTVEAAGLPRLDYPGFAREFVSLTQRGQAVIEAPKAEHVDQ